MICKGYFKKKHNFITNHSQKAFSQRKFPRLPWQHANYSAPCSAQPECQLWQSSSNMHTDVLVTACVCVISSGRWNVLSAQGGEGSHQCWLTGQYLRLQQITASAAHGDTRRVRRTKQAHAAVTVRSVLFLSSVLRGVCMLSLSSSFVLPTEQRSAAPDHAFRRAEMISEDDAVDRPERQCRSARRSDQRLFFVLKQHMWRADIAPSFIWWLVHMCTRQHPTFNL